MLADLAFVIGSVWLFIYVGIPLFMIVVGILLSPFTGE
jgi:hypothetical protein